MAQDVYNNTDVSGHLRGFAFVVIGQRLAVYVFTVLLMPFAAFLFNSILVFRRILTLVDKSTGFARRMALFIDPYIIRSGVALSAVWLSRRRSSLVLSGRDPFQMRRINAGRPSAQVVEFSELSSFGKWPHEPRPEKPMRQELTPPPIQVSIISFDNRSSPDPARNAIPRDYWIDCDGRKESGNFFKFQVRYGKILNVAHLKTILSLGLEPFRNVTFGRLIFVAL